MSVRSLFVSSTTTTVRPLPIRLNSGVLVDVALAAAVLVGTLALLSHGGAASLRPGSGFDAAHRGAGTLDLVGVVLAAASALPLVAWRSHPLGVFNVTAVASVLLAGLGYPLDLLLGPAVALYLLAASREPATPWTRRTSIVVVGLFGTYLAARAGAQEAFPGFELLHGGLAMAAAWFAGERTRLRRQHIADLQERARRAERETEQERLLAAAEERVRIARDLHDSAGHAISVIAVRAGAARLRHHQDPDRSLVALQAIEDLARQTADEIDHIVGSLRRQRPAAAAVEPPPGLASLETLIARHRDAGLEITLDKSGPPRPLSAAADQAAYRILQEGLTNAARHGTGRVRVELTFHDTTLELAVTNPVPAGRAGRMGGGHGVVGMRERVTLLGGSLDARRANGTFRVHVRIPTGDLGS